MTIWGAAATCLCDFPLYGCEMDSSSHSRILFGQAGKQEGAFGRFTAATVFFRLAAVKAQENPA